MQKKMTVNSVRIFETLAMFFSDRLSGIILIQFLTANLQLLKLSNSTSKGYIHVSIHTHWANLVDAMIGVRWGGVGQLFLMPLPSLLPYIQFGHCGVPLR